MNYTTNNRRIFLVFYCSQKQFQISHRIPVFDLDFYMDRKKNMLIKECHVTLKLYQSFQIVHENSCSLFLTLFAKIDFLVVADLAAAPDVDNGATDEATPVQDMTFLVTVSDSTADPLGDIVSAGIFQTNKLKLIIAIDFCIGVFFGECSIVILSLFI